jgi:O-antigen ligase
MNFKTTSSSLDTLCRLTGFLFLALIPLVTLIPVTRVPFWLTEDLLLRWTALLTLLFCSLRFWQKATPESAWNLGFADMILIFLSVWTLLSANNSQQSFDSFYALKNLWVMVLFWFSLRALWELFPDLYPKFFSVFWGTSVVAAAWVFISTAGRWPWLFPRLFENIVPRQGFFANSNIAAGFLGMALIAAVLKMIRRERVNLIAFLIVLAGWAVTQSRGAFLAMIVVVVVYAVLNTKEIEQTLSLWKSNQWVKFGAVVLVLVLACVPMVNRLFNAMELDPRAYFRVEVWSSAFHMAMAQPLWGFGPGTFGDVYPIYRSGFLWNTVTDFAHNEYLQVAAECGLPALLFALLLLWSLLTNFWKSFRENSVFKTLSPQAQAAEFAFYMILFEAVHDLVDFTLHNWSHRLVLLGFLTFALKKNETHEDLKVSLKFSPRAQMVGLSALLVALLWVLGLGAFKDYLSQIYYLKSAGCLQSGDLDKGEMNADQSIFFRPNNTYPWNSLGYIADARASLAKTPRDREKLFTLAKKDFDQAVSLAPYSLEFQENEVQDLVKRGRLEDAVDLEKHLIEKAPEDPKHYLGLSMILVKLHRPGEALTPIQHALDIDDYFVPACLLKAQILEMLGRKREALKAYMKAQEVLKELHLKDSTGQLDPHIQKLQSEL